MGAAQPQLALRLGLGTALSATIQAIWFRAFFVLCGVLKSPHKAQKASHQMAFIFASIAAPWRGYSVFGIQKYACLMLGGGKPSPYNGV